MKTVIEMAREAGFDEFYSFDSLPLRLNRFAELVRADEREAILIHAKSHAFNRMHGEKSPSAYELERWIEARGGK